MPPTDSGLRLLESEDRMQDRGTIRAALENAYHQNCELLATLGDSDLARPTANPGWRVRQLAAHIAEDEGGVLFIGKRLARGKNVKAPAFLVDLLNWWTLRKHRRARPADLLSLIETRHRELMHWLDDLPAESMTRGAEVSQLGWLTVADFLVQSQAHSQQHAADLRAALSG